MSGRIVIVSDRRPDAAHGLDTSGQAPDATLAVVRIGLAEGRFALAY